MALSGRTLCGRLPKIVLNAAERGTLLLLEQLSSSVRFELNHTLSRKAQEKRWEKTAGFARIYPIVDRMTVVTRYVSKYVVKDGEIKVSKSLKDWRPNAQPSLEFGSR